MDDKELNVKHVVSTMKECLATGNFLQIFPDFNEQSGLTPNQAFVYQALLSVGRASKKTKRAVVEEDMRMWVQISVPFFLEFLGWSRTKDKTLRRTMTDLEKAGLILSRESDSYNRAKWYHVCGLWEHVS